MEISDIKIEKGFPVPDKKWANSKWSVVFDGMDIGDSFIVNDEILPNIMAYAYTTRRKIGERYSSRKAEINLHRVWRIE